MKRRKPRKRRRGGDGCGYLVWVSLLACFLLVVNAIVIRAIYGHLPDTASLVKQERLGRAVLFIGPFLLLIVQWMLIDRVIDFFGKSPGGKEQ